MTEPDGESSMNVQEMMEVETFLTNMIHDAKGGSLTIHFNDHKSVYRTARQTVLDGSIAADDFISEEEFVKAMNTDTIWNIHWYPSTPVGFYSIYASSLSALLTYLKDEIDKNPKAYT